MNRLNDQTTAQPPIVDPPACLPPTPIVDRLVGALDVVVILAVIGLVLGLLLHLLARRDDLRFLDDEPVPRLARWIMGVSAALGAAALLMRVLIGNC
ncbi:hypothetical protein INN71_01220 [Nocardioides sp. ChNu-153]|uniref:hypothetical protein n=1 Tax=unclassified Nocardioides TaxID=2615069 RepID=UPI002406C907|nr:MULTISPECIES: hypothetical protein [unclassified Nocardioides]MDF9714869.1 hypothetical protein [Nocardioides sp. ChNu-99]MDN7120005.1 hypothetical protein [Nocardioides sp. ChNu-153]